MCRRRTWRGGVRWEFNWSNQLSNFSPFMNQKHQRGQDAIWHASNWRGACLAFYARRFPDHPMKLRVLHWLARAFWCTELAFKLQRDCTVSVNIEEYVGGQLLMRGNYEPKSIALCRRLMLSAHNEVFLDVGANQGIFTCAMGSIPGCRVVAVEAAPEMFCRLLTNVRRNPTLRVDLIHACVGPNMKCLEFIVPDGGMSAWGRVKELGDTANGQQFWTGILPLEMALSSIDPDLRIQVLKIDVEGFEVEVFKGLNWNGPFRPRNVVVECSLEETSKIDFLVSNGYAGFSVDGDPIDSLSHVTEGNLWFRDAISDSTPDVN